ncbi:MAG TPA: oligopeptide/dipeptide ABC transporter ATP-binding protein [Nitrososphaerales archaeon]|nr:oligopeptide/dipeptide ABC transporter ATP-binding protein [Nitrososphaerales archaeon]
MGNLVEIDHLTVSFRSKRRASLFRSGPSLKALDDVTLTIGEKETFGLTGETGSGKSTLAKVLVGLYKPTSGTVRLLGRKIDYKKRKDIAFLRQNVGIVFQDPVRSLNPSLTVKEVITEALIASKSIPKKDYDERIDFINKLVGVTKDLLPRRPRELSGGQRQRISLARALVVPKKLLVLDEPTSALDVSIQAQVLNTLKKLKSELDMSYLFITHDINVIKYVSHRLGVLFYGRLVEIGDTRTVDTEPKHPYTQSLISHVLTLKKAQLQETVVSEHRPAPSGCRYRIVCPAAFDRCAAVPLWVNLGSGHLVSCFLYDHLSSKENQALLPTAAATGGDLRVPPHEPS